MRSIQDFGHLLDLDKLYCQRVLIMWTWQLPFNRIWKCVVGHQRRRCRARTTRLRGAKFEKWSRIRALSRSGGQQLLSADELCDTPPGVLFQYSRGAGQAPPRESRLYHFRALKGSRPALLLPAQRKWRRREVYPAPQKKESLSVAYALFISSRINGELEKHHIKATLLHHWQGFHTTVGARKNLQSSGVALSVDRDEYCSMLCLEFPL